MLERLDRRLHRPVELRHGRGLDAHPGQHPDRHLSLKAVPGGNHDSYRPTWSMPGSRPKGSLEHLSQEEIAKLLDSGQGGLYPLFRKCALAVLSSGIGYRRCADHLREVQGLRPAHHAPRLGHQARDQECSGVRLRRRRDDPRPEGSSVRRAARRGVHLERNHGERPLRPRPPRRASPTPCSTSCATRGCWSCRCGRTWSCAGAAIPSAGSSTTTPRKSATSWDCAASDVCTGCGPGAMKGPDEGRDHRPFQAAHRQRPLSRHHRARHHRAPSRPIPSSASW